MPALLFSTRRLRRVSIGCLMIGVLLLAAMVYCAITGEARDRIATIAEGVAFLMLGVGLSAGLRAMARILEAQGVKNGDGNSELLQQLAHLRATLDEITSPATTLPPGDQMLVSRIEQALEEIREFTLMTDRERNDRLNKVVEQRRRQILREVAELVGKHEWAKAEHQLTTLESHFPNDNDVAVCRYDFNRARSEAEDESVREITRRVTGLVAMESFDPALAACLKLVEDFPSNTDARALLQSVQRERDLYIESTAQKLFDEILTEIERRNWRGALPLAQRLINRFPQHARTIQIREQLSTIHDNAEIQERQEIEVRIEELVRSQRFGEAISLGEDVVRRFPMSPQAQTLQSSILPRLREVLNGEGQPAV